MKRNIVKTIILHIFVITIIGGVFCHGYIMGFNVSKYDRFNVYAEDNWSPVSQDDLVTAFKYYCKSRNLAINGSIADSLTTFTTDTFNKIVSVLGIDPTVLQAEIKKTTDGNLGLRFLFSQNGVNLYNRIFAEFLQNNDLEVGDNVDNEVVYSGKYFTDYGGNKCLVYYVNDSYRNAGHDALMSKIGSFYKYDYLDLASRIGSSVTYQINRTQSFTYNIYDLTDRNLNPFASFDTSNTASNENASLIIANGLGVNNFPNGLIRSGTRAIIYNTSNNKLYFGHVLRLYNRSNDNPAIDGYYWYCIAEITDDTDDTDITVDTPGNTTINNNTYNNTWTIIYNDGDTYIDNDDPEPPTNTPPGGGGDNPGGGGGGDPDDWNPTVPDIPDPENPTFPNIDLPDIDIPNLPSLNFSLGDLRNKFPFSLPFDIIAVLNVLDGEPQAPVIDATIPIGSWYTWEFHADFSQFDNYARIFRAFEFIGFVIGLAVFTVHFAKG